MAKKYFLVSCGFVFNTELWWTRLDFGELARGLKGLLSNQSLTFQRAKGILTPTSSTRGKKKTSLSLMFLNKYVLSATYW